MKKRISILGCGWLGFPLAQQLKRNGFVVKGSTTNLNKKELLEKEDIQAFLLELTSESLIGQDLESFFDTDVLVISIPPKRKEQHLYLSKIKKLDSYLSAIPLIIFTSSTSVYPSINREIIEEDLKPDKASGHEIKKVEDYLMKMTKTCVLRLSGLIGESRHAGRFFDGKINIPNGLSPVNLVCQEDVVNIMEKVIEQSIEGIFNVCMTEHPSRKEFYSQATKHYKGIAPIFLEELKDFKKINGEKILREINYQMKYSDPMTVYSTI